MIEVYTDGGCRLTRDDKLGAWAFIILKDGEIVEKGSGTTTPTTVNEMEYTALFQALVGLRNVEIGDHKVRITSDSQLIINQVTGKWKVNKDSLRILRHVVLDEGVKVLKGHTVEFVWTARENDWTSKCDKMCNEAMDNYDR